MGVSLSEDEKLRLYHSSWRGLLTDEDIIEIELSITISLCFLWFFAS